MRDIRICDTLGRYRRDLGGCGLSTAVWTALFPLLAADPGRPLLAGLWQEQWGPAADATLGTLEVEALAAELGSLLAQPEAAAVPAAVRQFLDCLAGLCSKAMAAGACLVFVAD